MAIGPIPMLSPILALLLWRSCERLQRCEASVSMTSTFALRSGSQLRVRCPGQAPPRVLQRTSAANLGVACQ